MNNNTSVNIPEKYHHMISELDYDEVDGYDLMVEEGYYISDTESSCALAGTQKELLEMIRSIVEGNHLDL